MSVVFNKSRGASIYSQKFNYQLGRPGRDSTFLNKMIKSEIAMEKFVDYVDGLLESESDEIAFKKKVIGFVSERVDRTIDQEYSVYAFENITVGDKNPDFPNGMPSVAESLANTDLFQENKDTSAPCRVERKNMGLLFTHINAAVGTSNGLSSEEFYTLVGALRERKVDKNNVITYSARSGEQIRKIVGEETLNKIVEGIKFANPKESDISVDKLVTMLGDISDRLHNGENVTKIHLNSFYTIVDDTHARIARANPISIDNAVRVSEDIIKKTMDRLNKEIPNLAKDFTLEDTQVLFLNRSVITDPHLKKLKTYNPKVNEIISDAVKELNITGAIKAPMNFNGTIMTLARANSMVINNRRYRGNRIKDQLNNPELYNNDLFLNDLLTDFKQNSCFVYKTDELCKMITDNIELSRNYDRMDSKTRVVPSLKEASILARDKMMARTNKTFVDQKQEETINREQIAKQLDIDQMPLVFTKSGEKSLKSVYIFKRLFLSAMEKVAFKLGEKSVAQRQKIARSIYRLVDIYGKVDKKDIMKDISKTSSHLQMERLLKGLTRKITFGGDEKEFATMIDKAMVDVAKERGFVQNIIPINLLGDNVSQSEFVDYKHHRMVKPTIYLRNEIDIKPDNEQEDLINILYGSKVKKRNSNYFEKGVTNEEKLAVFKAISPILLAISAVNTPSLANKQEAKEYLVSEVDKFYQNGDNQNLAVRIDSNLILKRGFNHPSFGFNKIAKDFNYREKVVITNVGAILNSLTSDPNFLRYYYEKEIKPNSKMYNEAKKTAIEALVFKRIALAEQKEPKYDEVFGSRKVLHRTGIDGQLLKDSDVFTQEGKDKIEKVNHYYDRLRFLGSNINKSGAKLAIDPKNYAKMLRKGLDQKSPMPSPETVGETVNQHIGERLQFEKEVTLYEDNQRYIKAHGNEQKNAGKVGSSSVNVKDIAL